MTPQSSGHALSFDCFGTLVDVEIPDDPAAVVADELAVRGVTLPDTWSEAYRTPQIDAPPGAEVPLPEHVRAVLEHSGTETPPANLVEEAVLAAFETEVRTREGAVDAVDAVAGIGPVGVLSNCSVPGLVERSLTESALDMGTFDAVVTSVDCGWRKPDRRAFEAIADRLETPPGRLVHVGDEPETDGGANAVGARAILLDDVPLEAVPEFITDNVRNQL